MHILLYGPPGSGKSTTGRLLARDLEMPFIDADEVIESRAGTSIARIMQDNGEASFRELETTVLRQILSENESVVALGGGALLRPQNRELAEGRGQVICLSAGQATLIERLRGSPGGRPLLSGDLPGKLASLLTERREHYNSFPLKLSAEGSIEQVARQIQVAIGRFRLRAMRPCDVIVQDAGLDQLGEMLVMRGMQSPIVVTDENIARHHADRILDSLRFSGYQASLFTIPAGESTKTLDTVSQLWSAFLGAGLDRHSTVIALGGGVVSDLTGFAASTFMRGVPWVAVPTTMLAMVDASLGGKTGFDLPEGKNLIGTFHAPQLVLTDPSLLATLPEAELRSGLAEVVKHGVIADPELFVLCARGLEVVKANLKEIIRRAIAVKVNIIEQDPYEAGFRAALNLGHTVGHAVELVSKFRLRHGEAVAIGMVAEARLAEHLTVAGPGVADAIAESLSGLGLPIAISKDLDRDELMRAMRVDKKKSGGVARFALPVEIGKVRVGVELEDLESVFEED